MKLLIVDDSNIMRTKIRDVIRKNEQTLSEEFTINVAKNGVEAVQLFKENRPTLVTMDITMPHMNGIECIETMISIQPETKILVISALSHKSTCMEALKKGAQGFLLKPFSDQLLIESLQELMR